MPARNERISTISPGVDIIQPGAVATIDRDAVELARLDERITSSHAPFDETRAAEEVGLLYQGIMSASVRAGVLLVQANEHYRSDGGHGSDNTGFKGFCERAGIPRSSANSLVRLVRRMQSRNLLTDGESPLLAIRGGARKLSAMLDATDDDISALASGQAVDGIGTLADISGMTTAELQRRIDERDRKLAEKERQLIAAKDELAKAENRTENAEAAARVLRDKLSKIPPPPEVASLFGSRVFSAASEWASEICFRPLAERQAAVQNVMNQYSEMADLIRRALTGDAPDSDRLPLPDGRHLLDNADDR